MRAKGLVPCKPPVVYHSFLLAADAAIKSLGPGQRRHPILGLDFPHEGSVHQRRAQLAFFAPKWLKTPIFHRRTKVSLSFAQPSTGVPQTFCDSFIFQQQSWARMNRQTCGKTKFLGCIYTIDDYYGCPRFSRVPPR